MSITQAAVDADNYHKGEISKVYGYAKAARHAGDAHRIRTWERRLQSAMRSANDYWEGRNLLRERIVAAVPHIAPDVATILAETLYDQHDYRPQSKAG